jgi:hypothetical protein
VRKPVPRAAVPPRAAPSGRGKLGCVLAGVALAIAVVGLTAGWVGGLLLLPGAAPAAVLLKIDPPDAEVFVDGRKAAPTAPASSEEPLRLDLPEGPHDLKVEKEGFETYTRQIVLEAGKTERLDVHLEAVHAAGSKHVDGYEHLFNGKDLTGWALHRGGTGAWRVENGVLISGGPPSYLYYTRRVDFEDFDLLAEVMINDGGNSGLLFRTTFAPGLPDGFEAQIHCTARDLNRTGSLYIHRKAGSYYPVRSTKVLPNEWFHYEVSARGNHIVLKVNGTKVLDRTEEPNPYRKGHIALRQYDPATVVRFRTVDVKELPPPRAAGGH